MQGIYIQQFEDDTVLNSIGTLFRKTDGSAWGINLGVYPQQETRSLRFSQAPVLVRKRLYNQQNREAPKAWSEEFNSYNPAEWEVCRISDCPAYNTQNKQELKQYCFTLRLESGLQLYIPQFELARALFLHDGYMARTALEIDQLSMEFDVSVDYENEFAEIRVMPFSNYPLKSLNEPSARAILSWILIDPDARRSFDSISRYQLRDGVEINNYRRWDFQFDPPPLVGASFDVRGVYDRKTNSMFVFEITAIRNLNVELPEQVVFRHPKFKEYVRGQGQGGGNPGGKPPEGHNVHDGEEASGANEQVILRPPVVSFEFNKPFNTYKKAKKKQPGPSGKKDDGEPGEEAGKDVSVEEPDSIGGLPGADFESMENETDDAELYANKFDCFRQAMDLLVTEFGCKVTISIRKLKRRGKTKKHVLSTTGEPRCLLNILIVKYGKTYRALELDMSDEGKYLSTILIESPDEESWSTDIDEIEIELQKRSLTWPWRLLKKKFGKDNVHGIPHPETKAMHKGNLDPNSVKHWAERFNSWL